jgi:cobyrinic acid a,c-diamide synthase
VSLGYLPREERLRIPERYLGLVTADECLMSDEAVAHLADRIERYVDLDQVLAVAGEVAARTEGVASAPSDPPVRIGVARDQAFCFYYEDNFDALRAAGADLVAFSPLSDRGLPDGLDALYFGGGYPELWAEGLTANVDMQAAVRRFIGSGGVVYAECGGLMYLGRSIRGRDGRTWPMVDALPFDVVMTERLQQFGYVEVTVTRDCVLGAAGTVARGHSFHCSRIADVPTDIPQSYQLRYTLAGTEEAEGFSVGSVLASYIHLHFRSNPHLATEFVRRIARQRLPMGV